MSAAVGTQLRDRPVFICGHPKSGTSLLRNLLDSHPQLAVYPEESVFFRRFMPAAGGLDLEELLKLAEKRLAHFFEWNLEDPPEHQEGFSDRDYSEISHKEIVSAMRRLVNSGTYRHPGDVLSAAVLAYGEVSGLLSERTRYWVEKTPYNERFAGRIFGWWPKAKCIHIIRDPRDNYASYARKNEWPPEVFSSRWIRSARFGLKNREKFGASRYAVVRFEELVENQENTIIEICQFLGIDYDPVLVIPTRNGKPWSGNSMFDETFEAIDSNPMNRWKTELDSGQVSIIEVMTGRWMRRLGYRLQGEHKIGIKLGVLKQRFRAARWDLKNNFSGLFDQLKGDS